MSCSGSRAVTASNQKGLPTTEASSSSRRSAVGSVSKPGPQQGADAVGQAYGVVGARELPLLVGPHQATGVAEVLHQLLDEQRVAAGRLEQARLGGRANGHGRCRALVGFGGDPRELGVQHRPGGCGVERPDGEDRHRLATRWHWPTVIRRRPCARPTASTASGRSGASRGRRSTKPNRLGSAHWRSSMSTTTGPAVAHEISTRRAAAKRSSTGRPRGAPASLVSKVCSVRPRKASCSCRTSASAPEPRATAGTRAARGCPLHVAGRGRGRGRAWRAPCRRPQPRGGGRRTAGSAPRRAPVGGNRQCSAHPRSP